MSIERLIDASVHCVKCGARGVGTCDCWTQCSCGTFYERDTHCKNPATKRCSGKLNAYPHLRRGVRFLHGFLLAPDGKPALCQVTIRLSGGFRYGVVRPDGDLIRNEGIIDWAEVERCVGELQPASRP